mgnify:CR=1 FL=1
MADIIQLLPDALANQIAAGEVVQRPASAVKELLENAVDAGANDIQLVVKDAGKTLIHVTDNGKGMSSQDARLCFERHATSKIRQAEDLFSLHTKGFRGEALASIAAISHVTLKTKQASAVEVATAFLARTGGNPHNAFLSVDSKVTLAQAQAADVRISAGDTSPLLGVPIAHKDIFVTKDFPTTAGSKILEGYRSPFDATVVQKLADAGMVNLGKLNCDEFAMGSSTEFSAFGPSRNPWDLTRIPGGSGGGSSSAVAGHLAPIAIGSDTGGSIRFPAAVTGSVGAKPTMEDNKTRRNALPSVWP